jgi:enamine deaminase RidA (YjgF/YER057c/UK114 family)
VTLLFERAACLPDAPARLRDHLLGQHLHRPGADAVPGLPGLLQPAHAVTESWLSDAPVRRARTGCITHASDGLWLHGQASITCPTSGSALQRATRQLYADLFQVLRDHPGLQLLRLWNYLPHINAELDGLEVYRHFNIGRQQAFLDAGQSAFEGAPAACALGHHGRPITLAFLAGPVAPLPVENPRQTSAYHYPSQYGPRSPTFSRAVLVEPAGQATALFISGTASIVGHASVHAGDVQRQTEETLRNLQAVIDAAHASTTTRTSTRTANRFALDRMAHTLYLRHPGDLPQVRAVFEQALGADSPAARDALYLHADICRSDLLVEIEAHGWAEPEAQS